MTHELQRTPQGTYIPKQSVRPMLLSSEHPWESMTRFADPPEMWLGRHTSSRLVTMDQMLEMWNDELIGFLMSYLATVLIGGEYDIICRDPRQRRFFQSLYAEIHQDFMLKAAPALFFGYQALVKRFNFRLPAPMSAEELDVGWDAATEPLIIRDFLQIHPSRATALYTQDGSFDGISVSGLTDPIPTVHSMWITIGGWRSFGDHEGYGRAIACFDPWHKKYFTMEQRTLYVQTGVAPPVVVYFPSGEQDDGTSKQTIAQSIASNLQAASSVAMPSDTYMNGSDFERQFTSQRQWDVEYLINTANPGPFNEIKADEDRRIAMGMLVPPQTVMESKQAGLGGPNTAEVMAELAERVLSQDAYSLDAQINNHLFPALVESNFGPKAPPVYKQTKGLNAVTRSHLQTIFAAMLGSETNARIIDFRTIANRLNVPTIAAEDVATMEALDAATEIINQQSNELAQLRNQAQSTEVPSETNNNSQSLDTEAE
jgi:hypothetical protein